MQKAYPYGPLLIDAICEAYDNKEFKPVIIDGNGYRTFCNMAVHSIARRLDCYDFDGEAPGGVKTANDIVGVLERGESHNGMWEKIVPMNGLTKEDAAQRLANHGYLVVAGRRGDPHGHVAVIRPGIPIYSGKWEKVVPKCMNVGMDNFIAKGINYAFGDTEPEYYFLKRA